MLRICLPALAGATSVCLLPRLPAGAGVPMAVFAGLCLLLNRRTWPLAAGLAGLLAMWLAASQQLADRLSPDHDGERFKFIAKVVDFPVVNSRTARLLVAPQHAPALPKLLRLSVFEAERIPQLGEHWQFTAKLRRPRGSRNPGGFDYAGWLHRQGIGATGYVIAAGPVPLRQAGFVSGLRQHMQERLTALLPADDASAALLAIGIGARHRVTDEAWQRYAVTGTSHLMAISGLHIGLAAAGAGLLGWLLAATCRPRGNSRDVAAIAAVLIAIAYAILSGLAVPAQRACLMLVVVAFCLLRRTIVAPFSALGVVACVVLLADPLALLTPGYQLSFAAVAILLLVARQRQPAVSDALLSRAAGWVRGLILIQAALLLGLFPLTALLFARLTWLAPLANMLVLPLFSVLTVPVALLGLLLDGPFAAAGDLLLWLAYYSLRLIVAVLARLADLPGASLSLPLLVGPAALLTWLPALWVLLPRGCPGRYIAWLAMGAVLVYRPPPPPKDCVDLYTLDVGQGLASVIRTGSRTLLFDTGPAYRSGSNSAEYVVLPFLRSQAIRRLDMLIVSHSDQDHAGGVASVLSALPVPTLLSGEPLDTGSRRIPCVAGQSWRWDGIDFAVLSPQAGARFTGNNASCVLIVSAGTTSMLLSGDIERPIERRLAADGRLRPVNLVQVPHHGSATSSSSAFVNALKADIAVVSAGYGNRWGFPRADVVARWQRAGATVLTTAKSGAIQHRLCRNEGITRQVEYRRSAARYWHDRDD